VHRFRAQLSDWKVVHSIGARLKVWREAVSLKQDEAADRLGLSASTYQNYERDTRSPNTAGFEAFVRAGINANWLLTGEGPMLLADLVAPAPAAPANPAAPRINVDALAHAYAVTLQTAPKGETLAQTAKKAVAFYQYCFDNGLITEDGEGPGNLEGAA